MLNQTKKLNEFGDNVLPNNAVIDCKFIFVFPDGNLEYFQRFDIDDLYFPLQNPLWRPGGTRPLHKPEQYAAGDYR